jgi:hypothetical protein
MHVAVPKKGALFGTERQFVLVVWPKIRPTSAAKGSKRTVIGLLIKEALKRGGIVDHPAWQSIYKIGGGEESLIPIF